jgi:hypothetical protein
MKDASPLHFLRFEFKYVLDAASRQAVEGALQPFLELDPSVARQPDGTYFVRSLYFDDARCSAFHDKIDGVLHRSKFRLRSYGRSLDDPAPWFLEEKGRHDNLVWKHRTPLSGMLDRRARGEALNRGIVRAAAAGPVRDRFELAWVRAGVLPYVLVDYVRRPYVSRFDPEFRLTFDEQIAARATDAMADDRAQARGVLRGWTVMEVKFRRHVPRWFQQLVQGLELRRRSVSKVCAATEALGLASSHA